MKFSDLARPSLDDACRALFPMMSPAPSDSDPGLCRAAIIGFAGDQVRGSLGVATSHAGLRRVLDDSGALEDSGHCQHTGAEDALGELANLVLGAIKRKWLRRDVQITLATPVVIRGLSIEVCGRGVSAWFTNDVTNGGERITAWLDIHFEEALEVPDADSSMELITEGQTLLF